MRNVESYKPEKKVARNKTRNFSSSKKREKIIDEETVKSFNIKHDPKIIRRAIFYSTTTCALIGLIIFSAYKIIRWQAESDITNETISEIQKETEIITIDNPEHMVKYTAKANQKYLDMPLIDVDFSGLKAKNPHTAGWINVPGTSINYPYVQTDNNDFYLTHTFDGHWSDAGWVFLDYRNDKQLIDKNQIIYAHGRVDGSMFGSLQNVLTPEWQGNDNNFIVKIATETSTSIWQIFSVYRIPKTNDYLKAGFDNDESFKQFLDMIKGRSMKDFNIALGSEDRILTLSTCIGTNDRAVLHAKLIKEVEK